MRLGNIYYDKYKMSNKLKYKKRAKKWFNRAAKINYSDALIGLYKLESDIQYLEQAVNLGNVLAMRLLSNHYQQLKDTNKYIIYLEKAIELLDTVAMKQLSNYYYDEKDYVKSLKYILDIFKLNDDITIIEFAPSEIIKLLIDQYNKLKNNNKILTDINIELRYRPGGPGYNKAKESFDFLRMKN